MSALFLLLATIRAPRMTVLQPTAILDAMPIDAAAALVDYPRDVVSAEVLDEPLSALYFHSSASNFLIMFSSKTIISNLFKHDTHIYTASL